MIKKLLLIGALLSPALAYGGAPSTDLSVQLFSSGVGGGGGGGSGGGPTPPAAALAGCQASNGGGPNNGSCFNTLALNMDFTTSAAVSGFSNGTKLNAQQISNWLNCAGASSPVFYNNGFFGQAPPCSRISVVTDPTYGNTALDLQMQPSDTGDANDGSSISTTPGMGGNPPNTPTAFPTEKYVEFTLRLSPSNDTDTCSGNCTPADIWSYTATGGAPYGEWDFTEFYPNQVDQAGSTIGNACGQTGSLCLETHTVANAQAYIQNGITYHESYHTFGERITNDGNSNQMICFYVDGVQIATPGGNTNGNCQESGWGFFSSNPSQYLVPVTMILSGLNSHNNAKITVNHDLYITKYQIWECPNWTQATSAANGTACGGALISSNP